MIAREWKCRLPIDKYNNFIPYLYSTGIVDAKQVIGFISYEIRKRKLNKLIEITLITYWKDFDSIVSFAGDDIETAKLYPEDSLYELDSDTFVLHYEVVDKKEL